jgi:hypothetical protein
LVRARSHQIHHPLNLRHIIMQNSLFAAVIPLDGDAGPIRFRNDALIRFVLLPANAVADF